MSGPKSSTLDTDRQTQRRLDALRKRATDAAAQAFAALRALEKEARAYAKSREELADASRTMERIVADAEARVRLASGFQVGSDLSAADARVKTLEDAIESIVDEAKRSLEPYALRVRAAQKADETCTRVASFSQAVHVSRNAPSTLDAALEALASTEGEVRADAQPNRKARAERPAAPDARARLSRALEAARAAVADADTFETDRAALTGMARAAVHAASDSEAQELAAQAESILSRMAAQKHALGEARSRIAALEAALGDAAGTRRASFENADALFARLDELTRRARERDKRRYIRTCIDEAMRAHGYDVARSVDFAECARGEHLLFTGKDAREKSAGIHAFLSDAGDMMLEAVGVAEADGARDSMEPAADDAERAALMDAQARFCSVYAEIERDLAARGIVNAVRRKAPPDLRHCKRIRLASGAKNAAPAAKHAPDTASKKRSATRKPAQHRQQPAAQHRRRAETPRAREMK